MRPSAYRAGEQDRRLHLRTGHRQVVLDGAQVHPAVDRHRRAIILGGEPAPMARSGTADALHRPAAERGIADERRIEFLCSEQPHEEPHRRSGVAHVQRLRRRLQAVHANAMHHEASGPALFDAHTEALQSRKRRQAIRALEEAADLGIALGDAAEHQRAMRDRFIARHVDFAADDAAGFDHVLHVRAESGGKSTLQDARSSRRCLSSSARDLAAARGLVARNALTTRRVDKNRAGGTVRPASSSATRAFATCFSFACPSTSMKNT